MWQLRAPRNEFSFLGDMTPCKPNSLLWNSKRQIPKSPSRRIGCRVSHFLHVYQVANFKDGQRVMRAREQTIAAHCHSAAIAAAGGLKDPLSPPPHNWAFFSFPPLPRSLLQSVSKEHDLSLWIFSMVFLSLSPSEEAKIAERLTGPPGSETDP